MEKLKWTKYGHTIFVCFLVMSIVIHVLITVVKLPPFIKTISFMFSFGFIGVAIYQIPYVKFILRQRKIK